MDLINWIASSLILTGIVLNLIALILTGKYEDSSAVIPLCVIGGIIGFIGANLWH